jgi:hypothetical protein
VNLEVSLAIVTFILAVLSLYHAFKTRTASEAWFLLVMGVGFGYIFPLVDINVMGLYTFHGRLTLFNIPFHLGLGWFGLYYIALCTAELLLGENAYRRRVRLALTCGLIFGLMEAQWDPTLLALGLMKFDFPSFARYPLNFNPGFPMGHAYFGFSYAYLFGLLGKKREVGIGTYLVALGSMVAFPLGMMACVPVFRPVYRHVGQMLDPWMRVILDIIHFSTSFLGLGLVFALWIRFFARKTRSSP